MSEVVPREPRRALIWPDAVLDLQDLLADSPTPVYIVGGAVRDAYLHRPIKDIDLTVSEKAIPLARRIANHLNGDFFVLDDERAIGVREREVPVLREHEVEVELGGEPLVESDALLVEGRALRRAVVRADDGRVPAGGTGADVALLEDRDVRDPVVTREVVGRREAV